MVATLRIVSKDLSSTHELADLLPFGRRDVVGGLQAFFGVAEVERVDILEELLLFECFTHYNLITNILPL